MTTSVSNIARQRLALKTKAEAERNAAIQSSSSHPPRLPPSDVTSLGAGAKNSPAKAPPSEAEAAKPAFVLPANLHQLLSGTAFENLKNIVATVTPGTAAQQQKSDDAQPKPEAEALATVAAAESNLEEGEIDDSDVDVDNELEAALDLGAAPSQHKAASSSSGKKHKRRRAKHARKRSHRSPSPADDVSRHAKTASERNGAKKSATQQQQLEQQQPPPQPSVMIDLTDTDDEPRQSRDQRQRQPSPDEPVFCTQLTAWPREMSISPEKRADQQHLPPPTSLGASWPGAVPVSGPGASAPKPGLLPPPVPQFLGGLPPPPHMPGPPPAPPGQLATPRGLLLPPPPRMPMGEMPPEIRMALQTSGALPPPAVSIAPHIDVMTSHATSMSQQMSPDGLRRPHDASVPPPQRPPMYGSEPLPQRHPPPPFHQPPRGRGAPFPPPHDMPQRMRPPLFQRPGMPGGDVMQPPPPHGRGDDERMFDGRGPPHARDFQHRPPPPFRDPQDQVRVQQHEQSA